MNSDTGDRRIRPAHAGVLTVAAGLTLLTAACSGGSSAPQVASLGTSSAPASTGSTAAAPTGNPTQLLNEWATCMRDHGDPGQGDPTIDSNKVIHITYPPDVAPKGNLGSGPCQSYLTAASTALRGGQPIHKPDPAKLLAFSECMRANGIPDFPDPSGNGGLSIQATAGSDLNPSNPVLVNAAKVCDKKYGLQMLSGTPQPGSIQAQSSQLNPADSSPGAGTNG